MSATLPKNDVVTGWTSPNKSDGSGSFTTLVPLPAKTSDGDAESKTIIDPTGNFFSPIALASASVNVLTPASPFSPSTFSPGVNIIPFSTLAVPPPLATPNSVIITSLVYIFNFSNSSCSIASYYALYAHPLLYHSSLSVSEHSHTHPCNHLRKVSFQLHPQSLDPSYT